MLEALELSKGEQLVENGSAVKSKILHNLAPKRMKRKVSPLSFLLPDL